MSYIGSTPTTQNFIAGTDQFTGTGAQTNWTLSRFVNSVNDIEVVIANVVQNPTSYSVSGNTLTISPAVGSATVFYVRYLSTTLQSITPPGGTTVNGSWGVNGDLNFYGNARRITGDFSNGTVANRVAFQTSTANSATVIHAIPNGSSVISTFSVESDSALANGGVGQLTMVGGTDLRILSGIRGTGTYLPMTFYTGGSERMRVDTSGNVGIGGTPSYKLDVIGNANTSIVSRIVNNNTGASTQSILQISTGASSERYVNLNVNYTSQYFQNSGNNITTMYQDYDTQIFRNNAGTERARIDTSGNLLVGTTTKYGRITSETSTGFDPLASGNISNVAVATHGSYGGGFATIDGTQGYMLWAQNSGADFYIRRATTTSSATGGVYISNAAGSWSAASDERLKNILRPIDNAVEKLKDYRCVIGEYKDNPGAERPFLIAQDVQTTFPEAVNVMDAEKGYLGLSYTELIPLLTKAIQEQQALITDLQTRLAALETK